MAVNEYFNHFTQKSEQDLTEDLVVESIQIYGHDVYYLPRMLVNEDKVLGEDNMSKFVTAYMIEMYVKTVQGFEGEGDILGKLGLQINDQLTLTVSKKRFKEQTGMLRPREGDLVYIPTMRELFEVMFVEHESVFYQLGNLNVYDLKLERFKYSQQQINTGNAEIDRFETLYTYRLEFTLNTGTGSFAVGDTVYQGTNYAGATAQGEVLSWNSTSKVLTIKNKQGIFLETSNIKSVTGSEWSISTFTDMAQQELSDNVKIEQDAADIIDFSEKDPFSLGKY